MSDVPCAFCMECAHGTSKEKMKRDITKTERSVEKYGKIVNVYTEEFSEQKAQRT